MSAGASSDATDATDAIDATDVLPPEQDPRAWSYDYVVTHAFNCTHPTQFRFKHETGVTNGDCLPACFAAILEALHFGHIRKLPKQRCASQMRTLLVNWIKSKWLTYPIFQQEMQVHEIMWYQHDVGIPQEEREKRGEWPEDAEGRLAAYSEQCDSIYFADAEMLLFSCMMFELRGVPLLFRTFRTFGEEEQATGEHIANTPDEAVLHLNGIHEAVVVDLSHSGRVDGFTAHYRLLDFTASLDGLLEVHDMRPRKRKSRAN